jgi:hypothetical protein
VLEASAFPKTVHDALFRGSKAHWAGTVNRIGNASPPNVNCHCLVPKRPNEMSFFPCMFSSPSLPPVELKLRREDKIPRFLSQVRGSGPISKKFLPLLGAVLHERGRVAPCNPSGVPVKIPYTSIIKHNNCFLLASFDLHNSHSFRETPDSAPCQRVIG